MKLINMIDFYLKVLAVLASLPSETFWLHPCHKCRLAATSNERLMERLSQAVSQRGFSTASLRQGVFPFRGGSRRDDSLQNLNISSY